MKTTQGFFALFVSALLFTHSLSSHAASANPADVSHSYSLNRADEDYSYLRNPARRTDIWDAIKYLPFNDTGSWFISLGGEARERYEYFNNPNWGNDPQDNGYFLQRYFLHADLKMGDQVRLFGQLQSSLEDGRSGGPRPTDKDELDLHQAFLDLKFELPAAATLTLRSGRQEMAYGSQRIIAVREGPNVRQSFDGFRLMYRTPEFRIDGFATKPAQTKRYTFDDGPDNGKALWGSYAVLPFPPLPKSSLDLYYLGLYRSKAGFDQGAARETRHSVGTRLWRTALPLDYNFEAIYQWGSFGTGEIRAWTVASDTGYTLETLPLVPRLGLRADVASGDDSPANKDLQTFNPLFPKGAYFSEAGLIGPANFIDLNPCLDLHLAKGLLLVFDWDFFWRESTHDGLYNNAVVLVRSGRTSDARYIGSMAQAQLFWDIDRHLSVVGIYGHFLAGPFLKATGPGEDVDYLTTWLTYKF
jgi:hypothetical protein